MDTDSMNDVDLIQLSAAGDARAFNAFARRHGPYLLALLKRFGLAHEDAEDTAQQTFLRAFQALDRYQPERSAPRSWLSTIALNLARNARRGHGRRGRALRRFASEQSRSTAPEVSGLEKATNRQRLDAAIAALPEAPRTILLLRLDAELPFAAIAEQLGTTPAASKQRFHRAVRRLKKELDS
jgi:RNA polymerase sigma-70 factor (ECF subfamily)